MSRILGFIFLAIGLGLYRTYVAHPGILDSTIIAGLSTFIGGVIGTLIDNLIKKAKVKKAVTPSSEVDIAATTELPIILEEAPQIYHYGFGGWLYIFFAGLAFQLFFALKDSYDNYLYINTESFKLITTSGSEYYNSLWYPTLIFETIVQLCCSLLIIAIVFFCWKKRKIFRTLCIAFLTIGLIFNIIDLLLLQKIQDNFPISIIDDSTYDGTYQSVAYFMVWAPYFLRSKRVKNTYVK